MSEGEDRGYCFGCQFYLPQPESRHCVYCNGIIDFLDTLPASGETTEPRAFLPVNPGFPRETWQAIADSLHFVLVLRYPTVKIDCILSAKRGLAFKFTKFPQAFSEEEVIESAAEHYCHWTPDELRWAEGIIADAPLD